jgi:hypothetical protein
MYEINQMVNERQLIKGAIVALISLIITACHQDKTIIIISAHRI